MHKMLSAFSRLTIDRFWIILLLFLSISFFYFGTYMDWPYKIESDGKYYYHFLVSLFFDRDIDFSNNYAAAKYDWMRLEIDLHNFKHIINEKTQKPINMFSSGPALLWLPFLVFFYSIGYGLNSIFRTHIDLNPWGSYLQYSVMYSSVLYTFSSLYLKYQIIKNMFETKLIYSAILLITFCSNLYYYTIVEPSMSHVYDLFTLVLYIYFLNSYIINEKIETNHCVLLGFLAGLHILVRTQNIVSILIISIFLTHHITFSTYFSSTSYYKKLVLLITYTTTILITLTPLLLTNQYLFGNPIAIPQGSNFINLQETHFLDVLFSSRNGLFSHHPWLLFGFLGYILFIIRIFQEKNSNRYIFLGLAFVFFLQVYINSTAIDWWAGDSFGQRRLVSSFFIFTIGYAQLLLLIKKFFGKVYQYIFIPFITFNLCLGLYLALIHIYSWSYRQPHTIVSWLLSDPKLVIFDMFRTSDKLDLFARIDNQYHSNAEITIHGGSPSNEIQIALPEDLIVGCKYGVHLHYKTAGDTSPVTIIVQTPYQPTDIPLNLTFSNSETWQEKNIFFVPDKATSKPMLIIRNQSSKGTIFIKNIRFSHYMLDISPECHGNRTPAPHIR